MSTTGGKDRESGDAFDGPTAAFRRLLKDVAGDERARVDALVVLSQRTVFVATWPTDPESGIRTLTSSSGDTAMPVFSGIEVLKEAAQRFGWTNPDGSLSWRELGAREALRRAVARGVHFVVIDIGSEHSVEFARGEIEPLVSGAGRKDPTGPFAVSARVSTALMDAVRKTSRPPPGSPDDSGERPRSMRPEARKSTVPAAETGKSATPPPGSLKPAPLPNVAPPAPTKSVTPFPPERYATSPSRHPSANNTPMQPRPSQQLAAQTGGRKRALTPDPARLTGPLADPTGMTFQSPKPMPSDDALDVIADALRRFPEVEWAAAVLAEKDGATQPLIALRVDPAYRTRLPDLNRRVRLAAEDAGTAMGAVLLDDAKQMKSARQVGVVFFPWKKKAKSS